VGQQHQVGFDESYFTEERFKCMTFDAQGHKHLFSILPAHSQLMSVAFKLQIK
jgi:hypothetical protein